MYDLSTKFNTFYQNYVVLPKTEKTKLFRLKNLNVSRLKDGLKEYNEENSTNYRIVDTVVQGSVAMSTVTQNENKDYDIDVAIIFDKDNIPSGTTAVKNIVVNALKKKTKQFNTEPVAKTNCVRIVYADGYHIDFAIYRRYKDEDGNYHYEHCGSDWRPRDPRAVTKWFNEASKSWNHKLRIVVRLLKMFSKSRDYWVMPGGVILSVLTNENFRSLYRIDEMFYETLTAIKNRLAIDKEVLNPVDEDQSLKLIQKDDVRIENLYNRLNSYLASLDVLFRSDCTESQAVEAWGKFFNHDYWNEQVIAEDGQTFMKSISASNVMYDETEEFIEYLFPVDLKYNLKIDCRVSQDGWRTELLSAILRKKGKLRIRKKLNFFIVMNDVPKPYSIYWKVKNRGDVAKRKNQVRGQIVKTNKTEHYEETHFQGEHFVECYIVKDQVCVAMDRIDVPIDTQ
ncbi:nucleotide-binding domain-containing protein [Alicyclobacillus acidiphilus]|uniref:nucleotide-binding domain-containing protein n=1 Tax=Alicyclobacillus acidiphilus TaxID=182455 RepID=UPI000834721A|nr:nucleotidyltransferase [Alicyclobacillus acidiphilus]